MFRLNRNERSYWSGNGVHVESELVFMIGRNMQARPTSAGACADSAPTPRPQDACGRQLQALRATMQRIAAALATRSVVLVDVAPVGIELFLQYQQSCRLGQGLVFAPQLLLQLSDTLLVRFGLCLLRLL